MIKKHTMSASQMTTAIEWLEVSSCYAPDCREVMRNERFQLVLAMRSGDAAKIDAAMIECERVAKMWGVDLKNINLPSETKD